MEVNDLLILLIAFCVSHVQNLVFNVLIKIKKNTNLIGAVNGLLKYLA